MSFLRIKIQFIRCNAVCYLGFESPKYMKDNLFLTYILNYILFCAEGTPVPTL